MYRVLQLIEVEELLYDSVVGCLANTRQLEFINAIQMQTLFALESHLPCPIPPSQSGVGRSVQISIGTAVPTIPYGIEENP